jgi:hypothetical protein
MLRSFALFVATYAATAVVTYLLAYTPLPRLVSYQRYVCDPGIVLYPYDGLVVCGLFAGVLSSYALRRVMLMAGDKVVDVTSIALMCKVTTFGLFGMLLIYAAIQHAAAGCGEPVTKIGSRIAAQAIILSLGYAVIGHVWWDLRRSTYGSRVT